MRGYSSNLVLVFHDGYEPFSVVNHNHQWTPLANYLSLSLSIMMVDGGQWCSLMVTDGEWLITDGCMVGGWSCLGNPDRDWWLKQGNLQRRVSHQPAQWQKHQVDEPLYTSPCFTMTLTVTKWSFYAICMFNIVYIVSIHHDSCCIHLIVGYKVISTCSCWSIPPLIVDCMYNQPAFSHPILDGL